MAEAIEEANQGVTRTLKDLFGGAVGGVAQVLIGELSLWCYYYKPVLEPPALSIVATNGRYCMRQRQK